MGSRQDYQSEDQDTNPPCAAAEERGFSSVEEGVMVKRGSLFHPPNPGWSDEFKPMKGHFLKG